MAYCVNQVYDSQNESTIGMAERATRCFVLLWRVMYENRSESDHETYATLLSIIGTYMMRNVNLLEYVVMSLSKPAGSPAVLPVT